MSALNVSVVQQAWLGNQSKTLERTGNLIADAKEQGAQVVVLQELHALPYFCQSENTDDFGLSQPIDGEYSKLLARWSSTFGIVLIGCFFERRAPGIYHNTAAIFDVDGRFAGQYRKMHIPDDPGFYEKFYFTPGDAEGLYQGFEPVKTSIGSLGVLICWDQWYPEAARLMTLAGADLLIYPTAIGWDPRDNQSEQKRQLEAWKIIQRSHAVANGLPLISCNRIGLESDPSGLTKGIQFWGNSFICGPQGEIIAEANDTDECIIHAELSFERTTHIRQTWPYLRDRRVDAYAGLNKRYIDKD